MTLHAFEAFGIEIEYMVVDESTLRVQPVVDRLMEQAAGVVTGDHEDGEITWSNELAMHVVELKNTSPAPLQGDAQRFQSAVGRVLTLLRPMGCTLLPGGMHPLMSPEEFRRWPHDSAEIYHAYDRIFDCRGHGWSNLQSCHLNLPFADDDEFARVHLAARALLPILPALSAASPFCEGRWTGFYDWRLEVYRENQRRIPRIVGDVVPDPITSKRQYYEEVLEPIWRDIAPLDPEGLLRQEWLNSRGVVPKFFRDSLEIRLLDCQEAPVCDIAIAALIVCVLRALAEERWASTAGQARLSTASLAGLLSQCAKDAEQAVVGDAELLAALGLPGTPVSAGSVWRHLAELFWDDVSAIDPVLLPALEVILDQGPLARRMSRRVGGGTEPAALQDLMRELADCLATGRPFDCRA